MQQKSENQLIWRKNCLKIFREFEPTLSLEALSSVASLSLWARNLSLWDLQEFSSFWIVTSFESVWVRTLSALKYKQNVRLCLQAIQVLGILE